MAELNFMIVLGDEKNLEVIVDGNVKIAKTGSSRARGSIKIEDKENHASGSYNFKEKIPINDADEAFEWYKKMSHEIRYRNYRIDSPPEGGLVMIFPRIKDQRNSNLYGYHLGIKELKE